MTGSRPASHTCTLALNGVGRCIVVGRLSSLNATKLPYWAVSLFSQPDSSRTAGGVCHNVRHDSKASGIKQGSTLLRVQATVVERITFQLAYRASLFIAAGEHQRGARRGMRLKPREHWALIGEREMKEAVPSEKA